MKLRIRGDSLRLRLTKTETTGLVSSGFLENQVRLGEQPEHSLMYRVELSDAVAKLGVVFKGNRICVQLPVADATTWVQSKQVGIYSEESWGLKLAIEKDFKCLDPRLDEDESDAFENPHGTTHAACCTDSDDRPK